MNSLIKLVINYQNTKDDIFFEKILEELKNLIYYNIKKIPISYQEEIYQELLLGLYNVLITFKINYNIKINQQEIENQNITNKYLLAFIEKYKNDLLRVNNKDLFINEFILFCNENQFINYINKRFKSIRISFYQKQEKEKAIYEKYLEIIKLSSNNTYNIKYLDVEEKAFLKLFVDKERILTQKEVGDILGISQQAISRKLKKIKEKYKKGKV